MRILHTADWHLGKIFFERHLTQDQAEIIEKQFYKILEEENIDVVIIAGDIFDRAIPPVEAVELWDKVITKVIKELKIPMVVIAGNHDSASRLACGRELLQEQGYYVEGATTLETKPIVINDEYGPVYFCLMPFADTAYLTEYFGKGEAQTFETGYMLASMALKKQVPKGARKIAVAHAFVNGGTTSESERPLTLGGSEEMKVDVFDNYNYTALGHLHGPQKIGKETVRYSGSLMKYSFDEHKQRKSFTIIELDKDGNVEIELKPIFMPKDIRVLRGTFAELTEGVVYKKQIDEKKSFDDYILAELTDTTPVIDGLARLRKIYRNVLSINPVGRMEQTIKNDVVVYKNLDEKSLFTEFAKYVRDEALSDEEDNYMKAIWERVLKEE